MESESHLVQVAFEFEAGGVDEALVSGIVGYRMLVEVGVGAQRAEIEIENAVGLRNESGGLGRGIAPQVRGQPQQQEHE